MKKTFNTTFGNRATLKLLKGVDTLARAVTTTLGPRGRNVAIDKGYAHVVLHDGVSVSKAVSSKDPIENLGIKIVREAAQKQVMDCGDGTTLVTALSDEIFKKSFEMISAGINPMELRKGLESGRDKLVKEIKCLATPIETQKELEQVATISAEDPELGKMVAEVLHKVGVDGIVTVEESKGMDTWVDYQEGMQFDKGYLSHMFITDPETGEASIEKPYLFITDKSIGNVEELIPFFNEFQKHSKNIVFIAPEMTGTFLPSMIESKYRGGINVLCVTAPGVGDKQKLYLQDIAVLTGANFISKEAGMKFQDVEMSDLGQADRITSDKYTTIIVGGKGNKNDIKSRAEGIKKQMKDETSEWEIEKLKERLAKLTSGVAVIRVGGSTEVEMKERKERVIDAVASTKSAMVDGIVAGGETIFERIAPVLSDDLGEKVLKEALKRPFTTLISNAGMDAGEMRTLLKTSEFNNPGVDVTDGQIKDMIESGIIDSASIPKNAIINSVSVAIQLQSIGATVHVMPELPKQ